MKATYKIIILLAIAVISLLMHLPHLNKDLISIHVWRQTQTQTNIDNFYEEDFNILNPRRNDRGSGDGIFRMEFPLMQWMTASLYKVFGNRIIVTRLFMFVVGLFSVLGMMLFLQAVFKNDILAIMGAWAFNFSPSFYYYTINPLPDNLALCLSIWGLFLFFKWINSGKLYTLILSGFLLSVAALVKLPFILFFVPISSYLFFALVKKRMTLKSFVINSFASLFFIVLPLLWYVNVVSEWEGNGIVGGMLDNQMSFSVIFDYLQHNLLSVLPELLLNYGSLGFFFAGFYYLFKNNKHKNRNFIVYILWGLAILAYFIFEINMIAKIHDYYLFPFYPILFLIVSYGAYYLYVSKFKFLKYFTLFLLLILPFTAYMRMHVRWNTDDPGFNKDLLIYKKELRESVPNESLCVVGNDISHYIFFYYIDKKGWAFEEDNLSYQVLLDRINNGAEYLYTDSRIIDENPEIKTLLDSMIVQYGTVKIWKLKRENSE